MKSKKLITPVLVLLLGILLVLILYLNFFHGNISARVDAISFEAAALKADRMEIEMAMESKDILDKDIRDLKEKLREINEINLLDSSMISDDIVHKVNAAGVSLKALNIDLPSFASEELGAEGTLLYCPVNLSFTSSYNRAVDLFKAMEESRTAAYEIESLLIDRNESDSFDFNVTLHLYYFGNPMEVELPDDEESEEDEWLTP